MRLTNETMGDTLEVFRSVVDKVLGDLKSNDIFHNEVTDWLHQNVVLLQPHAMFRPDEIQVIQDAMLESEIIRTFLFDVQFRFYALAGTGPQFLDDLCDTLSDAVAIDGPNTELNRLPEVIRESMPLAFLPGKPLSSNRLVRWVQGWLPGRAVSVSEFLRSNSHLVIILLLFLGYEESIPAGDQSES